MDVDQDYVDKIFDYIDKLPLSARVLVINISKSPERLVNTVKYLIYIGKIDPNDIFFRSAYNKNGEKLGESNYQVLCKSSIPSSKTKLNKNGIKNDIDRESGPGTGDDGLGK